MIQTLRNGDRFVIILRIPVRVVEFVAYSAAMAAATALCVWVLLAPPVRLIERLGVSLP